MIVRRFCLFRRRTDPTCFVPDPLCFSRPHPYRDPVIVTPGQVARMLGRAADSLEPTPNSPLRPAVLRIALVLLYTAGLRRGELLRLTLEGTSIRRPACSGSAHPSSTNHGWFRCRRMPAGNCGLSPTAPGAAVGREPAGTAAVPHRSRASRIHRDGPGQRNP